MTKKDIDRKNIDRKDVDRKDEKWGYRNESYTRYLINLCTNKVNQHNQAGYYFKKKNTRWGLSMILLPVVMSPVSILLEEYSINKYVNAIAFISTGILSGIVNFYKYGEKMSNHFNYSAQFEDIKNDLELELVKERPFRISYEIFSTTIHMRIDSLLNGSPNLPESIADDTIYQIPKFDYKNFKTKNDEYTHETAIFIDNNIVI